MSDLDDDDDHVRRSQQRHAAKSTESDKASLLASGDERETEEYTDIFDEQRGTGNVVNTVDFEEGESVSASDEEVAGYTGDLENYTESDLDPIVNSESTLNIPEATLINIDEDEHRDSHVLQDENREKKGAGSGVADASDCQPLENSLVTNESISEIAVKLSEVEMIASVANLVKPGKPVKVSVTADNNGDGDNDNEGKQRLSESESRGYLSSGEMSKGRNDGSADRRKKYRKRTMSHGSIDADEATAIRRSSSSSDPDHKGEYTFSEHKNRWVKKKREKNKQEGNQQKSELGLGSKLIDIESPPPVTASKPPATESKPPVVTHSGKSSRSAHSKRKRTRHKVYLDDPDVHQLINNHILLLHKYADDLKAGKYQKKESTMFAGHNNSHQRSMAGGMRPDLRQHHPHQQQQQQQSHLPYPQQQQQQKQQQQQPSPFQPHHQPSHQLRSHHHQQQQPSKPPQFYGTPQSNAPYQNQPRGKNFITRIRNEDAASSSSSDDDFNTNQIAGNLYNRGYNQVKKSDQPDHRKGMYLCPDCGDYHPENEVADVQDICPDCGVAHNPYQHPPSQKNQWQKYSEACRQVAKQSKQYERLSTEQDPEDVRQDTLPSIEGPHREDELTNGVRYKLKYLGSCQITTQHPVTKETRMQQAQDAYNRIRSQDGDEDDDDDDVSTNVDMFISLERIKIINKDTKFEDVMMDHALRTVCFICDMGNILVLMARRLTSDHSTDFTIENGKPISLGNIVGDKEKKSSKNICHVFEGEIEASKIAKAIGQAFNIAYRQFLQSNGIAHEHVEEAEYCHVLESQKLVGQDLDRLTDQQSARDIVIIKKRGDPLGIMLLESGWGSMLPTVFIAHLANYSAAARSQRLKVGDHVLSCNGASLVGLPLSECNTILKDTRSSERVLFRVVSCPPVVDVVVSRPDTKYQLGFSVQNGTICSLLRGGIAERGGVRVGHRIIEINGDSVVAKPHQHIVDILANTIGSISMKTMPVAMYRLMVGDDLPLHV